MNELKTVVSAKGWLSNYTYHHGDYGEPSSTDLVVVTAGPVAIDGVMQHTQASGEIRLSVPTAIAELNTLVHDTRFNVMDEPIEVTLAFPSKSKTVIDLRAKLNGATPATLRKIAALLEGEP